MNLSSMQIFTTMSAAGPGKDVPILKLCVYFQWTKSWFGVKDSGARGISFFEAMYWSPFVSAGFN